MHRVVVGHRGHGEARGEGPVERWRLRTAAALEEQDESQQQRLFSVKAEGVTILSNFLIVAFCVFMIVKLINRARRQPEPAPAVPPAPTREETLHTEIRDAIRGR